MARYPTPVQQELSDDMLDAALVRAPADQYVIWNGRPCPLQPGSSRSQVLGLIETPWDPVSLRVLLRRAARAEGRAGLHPDTARNALRMHQGASRASYFLVRRTLSGDYVAVADVPFPSCGSGPLRTGDVVLTRAGQRFEAAAATRSPTRIAV